MSPCAPLEELCGLVWGWGCIGVVCGGSVNQREGLIGCKRYINQCVSLMPLYSGTSIMNTIGTQLAVLYREVSLIQR